MYKVSQIINLCFALLLFQAIGICQNKELDSLFKVLPKAINDTDRIITLGQITELCEFDDILKYCNQVIDLAEKNKSVKDERSKRVFLREKARAYNGIGYYYYTGSKTIDALENYQKGALILEKDSSINSELLNSLYNNIAAIETQIEEFDKALKTIKKCIKTDLRIGSKYYIGNDYNNMATLYGRLGNKDSALYYGLKAIEIRESEIKTKPDAEREVITYYTNVGTIYMEKGDTRLAEKYIDKAYQTARKMNDTASYSPVNYWKARLLMSKGKYDEAKSYLETALTYAAISNKRVLNYHGVYYGLYIVSDSLKDYKNAYHFYKLYKNYGDSMMNINMRKEAEVKHLRFEYDKREISLKNEHEKEIAVEQEKQRRQRVIIWFIIAFLILALASGLYVYRSYLQKKKINKELEVKNQLIEQQKQLVEEKQRQIVDSINYAKHIQHAILADEDEIKKHLQNFFVLYLPKDIVSGDFYWFAKKDRELFFASVDCTGHGVPGAFLSMVGSTLLNEIVNFKNITDPYGIIQGLAEGVTNTLSNKKDKNDVFADGMDISICKINIERRTLHFASVNHSAYIVDDKGLTVIDPQVKSVHGVFALNSKEGLHTTEMSLQPGSMVYMSTDGYADQVGEQSKKKLMPPRFKEVLAQMYKLPVEEQKTMLEKTIQEWKGNRKQNDDILVMGFRIPS